ncbi:MAG: protein-L-isoaspartate O-methyltransferase family protein [Terriglobales bacterium]
MDREQFARRVTVAAAWPPGDPRLFEAFLDTPREHFLPPSIPPNRVYSDATVGLGIFGINNGQPSLHALCLAALAPQPGETAVHVGAGTGYYTAILAHLLGPQGHVEAFEIDPRLAAQAQGNLAAVPKGGVPGTGARRRSGRLQVAAISVHSSSGATAPLPACDIVYVNCGATGPASAWLEALRPRGRLLFPLTGSEGSGAMLLLTRPQADSPAWPARFLLPVAFIGCQGARDPEEERAVTAAFDRGGAAAVRWFFRAPAAAPVSCWCQTKDWSLRQA